MYIQPIIKGTFRLTHNLYARIYLYVYVTYVIDKASIYIKRNFKKYPLLNNTIKSQVKWDGPALELTHFFIQFLIYFVHDINDNQYR